MQRAEQSGNGLHVGKPAGRLRSWIRQLKVQPQIPLRQVFWLCASLFGMFLIHDGRASDPLPAADKLLEARVQGFGNAL